MKYFTAWAMGCAMCVMGLELLASDTTIKGGSVEMNQKGEEIHFHDGVKLERGGDSLKSKEMKTNKDRTEVTAWGNVKLFRIQSATQTLRGFGEFGFYDTKKGNGYLLGDKTKPARIHYEENPPRAKKRIVDVFAKRIEFSEDKSHATGIDDVYGETSDPKTGDQYRFWATQADYYGLEKKIVLTGLPQPKILQYLGKNKKQIRGNVITYYLDTRKIISDGDAIAVFQDEKKKKK